MKFTRFLPVINFMQDQDSGGEVEQGEGGDIEQEGGEVEQEGGKKGSVKQQSKKGLPKRIATGAAKLVGGVLRLIPAAVGAVGGALKGAYQGAKEGTGVNRVAGAAVGFGKGLIQGAIDGYKLDGQGLWHGNYAKDKISIESYPERQASKQATPEQEHSGQQQGQSGQGQQGPAETHENEKKGVGMGALAMMACLLILPFPLSLILGALAMGYSVEKGADKDKEANLASKQEYNASMASSQRTRDDRAIQENQERGQQQIEQQRKEIAELRGEVRGLTAALSEQRVSRSSDVGSDERTSPGSSVPREGEGQERSSSRG